MGGYELLVVCLSLNLYHEARGEDTQAQLAVAQVTINRAKTTHGEICEVVFAPGQFSWTAWGFDQGSHKLTSRGKPKDSVSWKRSMALAVKALTMNDFTHGATYYHEQHVKPKWADEQKYVGQWGHHLFYKRA